MRVETAVVNMVEAARSTDISPAKLSKVFELALEKVSSLSPVGADALKIVQTNLVKDLLKQELNVVARIAKGPRAPRGSKKGLTAEAKPIREKTFEEEIDEVFAKPQKPAKKTVARKPRQKRQTDEVTT
jgi:hypothetical protein